MFKPSDQGNYHRKVQKGQFQGDKEYQPMGFRHRRRLHPPPASQPRGSQLECQ